jgi:hypothetical protein
VTSVTFKTSLTPMPHVPVQCVTVLSKRQNIGDKAKCDRMSEGLDSTKEKNVVD